MQLAYLERSPKAYIHATWSSTEFLLFEGVDKLILNVDFQTKKFTFVSKRELLAELALTSEEFLDLGILAGFQDAASLPISEFSFSAVLDLLKANGGNGAAAIAAAAAGGENPQVAAQNYIEQYCRSKAIIRYSLVLAADEGRVLPLPLALPVHPGSPALVAGDVPADLHDVFSHRLPDELYFHLFRGLISPHVLAALTTGLWTETAPLCGGESEEYKRFLKNIITEHSQSPRCTAVALLATALGPFWQKKPVVSCLSVLSWVSCN
jgi:hypothetical protein